MIEALVALVLASVGLLGLARLQVALSSDAGGAAQRLEAQRLLNDKIEQVRQLDAPQLAAFPAGSDQISTSDTGSYTRSWAWTGGIDPQQRLLQTTVNWTDRSGQVRSVQASTLVQPPEGRLLGALSQPLQPGQTIRGPMDRYIDVPLGARPVGDGRSSFQIIKSPLNQTVTFVVDDSTGRVVQRCANAPTVTQLLNNAASCQSYNGVVLSGFVSGANQTISLNLFFLDYQLNFPSRLDTSEISGAASGLPIECAYREREEYADNRFILVINGSATFEYTCVIPLTANSAGWSGYLQLAGDISLSVVARMCRYQFPDAVGADSNRRNVQRYRNVTQSLFNQNYRFVIGSSCDGMEDGVLVEHQRCVLFGLFCSLNRT